MICVHPRPLTNLFATLLTPHNSLYLRQSLSYNGAMKRILPAFALVLLSALPGSCSAAEPARPGIIHHDLNVRLEPEQNLLTVEDSITLPPDRPAELTFMLHEGLNPITPTPGVRVERTAASMGFVPVESFRISLPQKITKFVLRYSGTIDHSRAPVGRETARGFSTTPGSISEEGIFLAGSSVWYPEFFSDLLTFTLETALPQEWDAVSQGVRTRHRKGKAVTYVRWESPEPMDQVYLVAGKYTEYTKSAGKTLAMVFLRRPDKKLADQYLFATAQYVAMYESLIGPYPYRKFALVENFWETGYGMPSFTLLGPKVIRFPFIIVSSYPHEILHTWWGNCVYPDYAKGNWAEGLTAYLADHLLKEQQGRGTEYRQTTLQKYADYVTEGRDFPLTSFRSRHSSPSEAIGYGKSLMLFHMLRRELGDGAFTKGLRRLYRTHKFSLASFSDLRKSFESVTGRDLKPEFDQWVERTGAPELRLGDAATRRRGEPEKQSDNYVVTARIEQVQAGNAYRLRIPIAVTMEGVKQAYQTVVEMKEKRLDLKLTVPARPLRLDVDPEFDLFRRLSREEIPPAISQALGAKRMLILLPSAAGRRLLQAYRALAQIIGRSGPENVEIKLDRELKRLPADRTVTILGWENLFSGEVKTALSGYDVDIRRNSVRAGEAIIPRKNHSVVLTAKNPGQSDEAIMMIATDTAGALPGLGRKLPHYHKYSYLGFRGAEPVNIAKGRWRVLDSPMTVFLPGTDGSVSSAERGKLKSRRPLATLPSALSGQ